MSSHLPQASNSEIEDSVTELTTGVAIPLYGQVRYMCLNCTFWRKDDDPTHKGLCTKASEIGSPLAAFSLTGRATLWTDPDHFCSSWNPDEKTKSRLANPKKN